MKNSKYLIAVGWLACGICAAGINNADMNDGYRWSTKEKCEQWSHIDQSFSIMWGVFGGPISLVVIEALSGFGYKGWSLARHECNYEK